MKKLHLITAMYTSKGHGMEYVRNFCSRLSGEFDIVLYVASKEKVKTPDLIKVKYIDLDFAKTNADNFTKYSIFAPYIRAIVKQFFSRKYYKGIIKTNEIREGDLVYIMDYDVIPLIYLMKRLKKIKALPYLWIHSARFKSKDIIYSLYKWIFKYFFNKYIVKIVTGVIVNGDLIKSRIIEHLKVPSSKITVIQYPSEINYQQTDKEKARQILGFGPNEKLVLFFGMLRKDKNIEKLIEYVARAKNAPFLIIAGSEASVKKEDVEAWIDKYELMNYRLDIDYISEEKMALYYSCSDLLLLTYNLESASQSGPLSLAREFGLPAVVNDVGEIGHYVKSNNLGMTANPINEEDFTNKIDFFFENKTSLDLEFAESIELAKTKYSWSSASTKYLTLFNGKGDI